MAVLQGVRQNLPCPPHVCVIQKTLCEIGLGNKHVNRYEKGTKCKIWQENSFNFKKFILSLFKSEMLLKDMNLFLVE